MRLSSAEIHRAGRRVWCAPFHYISNEEVAAYRSEQGIPESPVRQKLCLSGECLCGAFARPGELKEIEFFFPQTGAYLRELQCRVRAAGFPWGWDERRPAWFDSMREAQRAGQADAFEEERTAEIAMLCTSCHGRYERHQAGIASRPETLTKSTE